MEIWQNIPGYEGKYQASSFGRVRSVPRKWVKAYKIKKQRLGNWRAAYFIVSLGDGSNNVAVHRLVALAFHGVPAATKTEVNHIDGDKTNNRADNLEWVSSSENRLHAYKMGFHKKTQEMRLPKISGIANKKCALSEKQVKDIFERFRRGDNRHHLAKEFGVTRRTVYNIGQGKTLSSVTKAIKGG